MIESIEEFIRLVNSEKKEEYQRARTEEASEDVWMAIIDKYCDLRLDVVRNKTVPLSILKRLAADNDSIVRSEVASKRKATPELLLKLSSDDESIVRFAVACNKSTPKRILELMVDDDYDEVVRVAKDRLLNMVDKVHGG
jgi:hypothetical protein